MVSLDSKPIPPDALIRWAVANQPHNLLRLPADFPWYWMSTTPRRTPDGYRTQCRCQTHCLVSIACIVGTVKADDWCELVYIGQCQRGCSVLWRTETSLMRGK